MEKVKFRAMADGDAEDYRFLDAFEHQYYKGTAKRVLAELALQGDQSNQDGLSGYQVSRLEHALQTATRAMNDNADDDWIVAALLHDIGDRIAPQNHDTVAAEILRPFVREEVAWAVEHHGVFQMYYYAHHLGKDREARQKYAGHPYFQTCADFCERWDQPSFDPDYQTKPLQAFAPLVEKVFARPAWHVEHLRPNQVVGLP